jgi:pyridoxal 5-phosphate dependent beta-lyase
LQPRLPPPEWKLAAPVLPSLELGEANVAARVGFSVAVGEHMEAGPERMRARLAEVGQATRDVLADLPGWRVIEPPAEPTAITTLESVDGVDLHGVRSWLIAERRLVTTVADFVRAPFELGRPVLRISPHVDVTADDLDELRESLGAAVAAVG